ETQMREMEDMKLPELQQRFAEVTGEETKAPNKTYLIKSIIEALKQNAAKQNSMPESEQHNGEDDEEIEVIDEIEIDELLDIDPTDIDDREEANENETTGEKHDDALDSDDNEAGDKTEAGAGGPTDNTQEQDALNMQPSGCEDSKTVERPGLSYDTWQILHKIREVKRGKGTMGTDTEKQKEKSSNCKVLPLRMDAALVEKIDEAWKRQGLKSRMHLFRISLKIYLDFVGEKEASNLIEV
ncbi:MAG: hypothetical protein JXR76_02165, partial [Deltaproteobacteria bacterium]|nr:hypothetical protein [Deltaproteobacteria bacterium]